MEIAVAHHFGVRANLIVPNISWGMFNHECDLFVLTGAGYGYEVEIKVSKHDLIKDEEKPHGHYSPKIKYLFFAVPDYLEKHIEHIPERAGIIIVTKRDDGHIYCERIRKPKKNYNYSFDISERYQIARLGAMRIFGLKQKIVKLKKVKR